MFTSSSTVAASSYDELKSLVSSLLSESADSESLSFVPSAKVSSESALLVGTFSSLV